MTDKILCPWCGAEMESVAVHHTVLNGETMWNAWTSCKNDACDAEGPFVPEIGSKQEALEAARAAALRRYEPQIRPLTKDEVKEHTVTRDASPLWMEWKVYEDMDEWVTSPAIKSLNIEENYGRVWRCWPRKPTEQERQAAGWEDAE